jgi:flagellar assembly protein FliH
MKEMEHDLSRLAIEIAKKLVHREIKVDKEIIFTLVRVALEKVVQKAPVTVYLNPTDLKLLNAKLEENGCLLGEREIVLKEKSDLSRGDCLLESPYGDIDARISEQFKRIEHNFLTEF